jgi:hypothetical protein
MLLIMLSLSIERGIRGNYGHEYGNQPTGWGGGNVRLGPNAD